MEEVTSTQGLFFFFTTDEHFFRLGRVEVSSLTQSFMFTFRFNLIRFASEVVSWKPNLTSTSDDSCQDAVEWVSDFDANGSTSTLNALQVCFYYHLPFLYIFLRGKSSVTNRVMDFWLQTIVKIYY